MTEHARGPVTPLLPDRARRPATLVLLGCAGLLAAGGVLAAGRSRASGLDRSVDTWLIGQLHGHVRGLTQITDLATGIPFVALTVIVIVSCLAVRRVNGAILAAICVPVAGGLTELVLKPVVHETIGHPAVLSYPSGHTTNVFTLVAVVAVLLADPPRSQLAGWLRITLATAAALVGCAVAVSLIAIQFHYFTDTVGGICVATGVVLGISLLLDAPAARARMGRWSLRSEA